MSERGRGRPAVFVGELAKQVVKAVAQHGISHGQRILADDGISISRPTLSKLAKAGGVKLQRGRRKVAA